MTPAALFLDRLKAATVDAESAEETFRRESAAQAKQLEQKRAFAYRRFNLMCAVADGIASAENEEMAVATALAVVRTKIGWSSDSEARSETLTHFAPVASAIFRTLEAAQDGEMRPDVIPETPRVDF